MLTVPEVFALAAGIINATTPLWTVVLALAVRHLASFTQVDDDALIFTSPTGKPLRHGLFRSRVWVKATSRIGLAGLHFHDLRHTGNMLTAATGATLRELMDRMGHSTTRAALIYLHGSDARQHEIADALSHLAEQQIAALPGTANGGPPPGQRARNGHERLGQTDEHAR